MKPTRRTSRQTDSSAGWSAEALRDLIEPVREEVKAIVRTYAIRGAPLRKILSRALISAALTNGSDSERQRLLVDAVERACREERAALGPPEDQEDDPHVH